MLFGKPKPSEVGLDESERLLEELFAKKLGAWTPRMERFKGELAQVQENFVKACERFDELRAEPYMENLFWMDPESVKRHKVSYSRALKNVIERFTFENDIANPYQKYEAILADAEGMNGEMLKTNATFKQVLYCYSPHIGDFKRISSQLERLLLDIRSELSKKSREYEEYKSLSENISKLESYVDDLNTIGGSIDSILASLDAGRKDAIIKQEHLLLEELNSKKSAAKQIEDDEKALLNKVHGLVSSLGRASKKFDHISPKKLKLNPFVEAPLEHIKSERDYKEFVALLFELRESMDRLDIKNSAEVLRNIEDITGSEFYYMIESARSLNVKKSMAREEVEVAQRMLNELHKSEKDIESMALESESMKKDMERIKNLMEDGKRMVEKQFWSYYAKAIALNVHSAPKEPSS